jgi:hypothetical protein
VEAGCDAALAGPLNESTSTQEADFEQTRGVSSITEILEPEATSFTTCGEEAKIGSGSLEHAAEEGVEKASSIEREEKLIPVEWMNP